MNLIKNFKLIDQWDLARPDWEFVKSSSGLKKFAGIKDYCGWTIRVLYTKPGSFRKPIYVNWLPKSRVKGKIDQFAKQAKKDYVIVVYPSWKLFKSGTLLIDKDRIVVEACRGSIDNLMRHGLCELRLTYDNRRRLINAWGKLKFLSASEKKKILSAMGKVKKKGLILEWAVGQRGEFIFQKLEDVKQAGKLLLKKYLQK